MSLSMSVAFEAKCFYFHWPFTIYRCSYPFFLVFNILDLLKGKAKGNFNQLRAIHICCTLADAG